MQSIPLPERIEIKETGTNQADVIIEPAYPGYGNTLGNSLRRVLLSSLPGAAITAAKIKGVTHEFTTLPGVKEDIVEIILNLKKLRFHLHETEEAKATLKVKGEKEATGSDFKLTSDIVLGNPEQHIATLTAKDAELEIEVTIKTGRGYLPVENMDKKDVVLGTINVDAIFTPIKNVNYRVENVRVGQMTNYDRIIMSVTTDGTMSPADAVRYAASILVEHFNQIAHLGESSDEADAKSEEITEPIDAETPAEPEKAKKKRGRPKKEDK